MTTSMLAQEHISYINAVQYGDGSRTSATVQAAQDFIGSAAAVLLLPHTGDGVWTLNANHVFGPNIVVFIPAGVVLAGSGNLTFNLLRADNSAFYAGTGTLTFAPTAPFTFFNQVICRRLGLNTTVPILAQLHVSGDVPTPATILVEQRTLGAGSAGMSFYSAGSEKAFLGLQNAGGGHDLSLTLEGTGGNFLIGGPGGAKIGLNTITAPLAMCHLSGNAALPASLRLEENAPSAGGAQVTWWSAGTQRGYMGIVPTTQDVTLQLSNSARFLISGGNLGIGGAPTRTLQLFTDQAAKTATISWEVISDGRVKEEIGPYTLGLDLLLQVRPVRYVHNGYGGIPASPEVHVGIIGQELQQLAPEMVGSYRAKLHADDPEETDLLMFKGGGDMIFALINAVKEQQALIQALTDRVAALEAALP